MSGILSVALGVLVVVGVLFLVFALNRMAYQASVHELRLLSSEFSDVDL